MSLIGKVGPFLLFGVAAHLITSADMALMMARRRSSLPPGADVRPRRSVERARRRRPGAGTGRRRPLARLAVRRRRRGARRTRAKPSRSSPRSATPAARCCRGPFRARSARAMAATGSMAISGVLLVAAGLVAGGSPSVAELAAKPAGPVAALIALGLFQHWARLFRLLPPDRNGGRDFCGAQQLHRSLHWRHRRRAGAG